MGREQKGRRIKMCEKREVKEIKTNKDKLLGERREGRGRRENWRSLNKGRKKKEKGEREEGVRKEKEIAIEMNIETHKVGEREEKEGKEEAVQRRWRKGEEEKEKERRNETRRCREWEKKNNVIERKCLSDGP